MSILSLHAVTNEQWYKESTQFLNGAVLRSLQPSLVVADDENAVQYV